MNNNEFAKICFEFYSKIMNKEPLCKEQTREFDNIYEKALYQGYLTACRTFHGYKYTEKAKELSEIIKKMLSENNNGKYDELHDEACDAFISGNHDATYGQAQKVINMAMKFLLVLYNIFNDKEYFEKFKNKYVGDKYKIGKLTEECENLKIKCKKCMHMPLDSYVLDWYKKYAACDKNKKRKIIWSKIRDFKEYHVIRDDIKSHKRTVKSDIWSEEESVIENEFRVWKSIKNQKIKEKKIC